MIRALQFRELTVEGGDSDSWETVRASSRILAKVSTMAMVVRVARGLFRIVAGIYNPFSVNVLGKTGENLRFSRW
ncbi:MAG: hypothetical protein LBS79_00075 [Tannerella sp.]|jgi:hypothetical protein|nr:hypothetical protein [Tannerella sp.]